MAIAISSEGGAEKESNLRSLGLETATATAAHADTEGAPYVHSPVAGGYKIQGDAVVKRIKRPTLRKTDTTDPTS